MKRIKYAIFLAAIILPACSESLLDIEQKGAIEMIPFYENATDADAESLIAAVAKNYYTGVMSINNTLVLNLMSDDQYCGGNSFTAQATQMRPFSYYTFDINHSYISSLYEALYKINYWCNLICEYLPDDTAAKKKIIGEAKFYRALCYYYLIRLWGEPPFVPESTTTSTPENGDPAVMWEWVERNLKEASDVLPSKSGLGTQKAIGGRPSREAALGFLGKAYVIQGKNKEASEVLSGIITSNKYALYPDRDNLFHVPADFCDEYLIEFNIENDVNTGANQSDMRYIWMNWRYTNLQAPLDCWSNGWGIGQSPTYEFIAFAQAHEAVGDDYSTRYHALIKSYDDVLAKEYAPGVKPGVKATGGGFVCDNIGYWHTRWYLRADEVISGTDDAANNAKSHANQPYLRYADILLLFAEAEVQQGRSTGAGLDALNEVRARAGLPALGTMTLQDVKDERHMELFAEGERFLDLVRWGDAATVLADNNKYRYGFYGKTEDGTYDVRCDNKVYGQGFKANKHERFPYPESELLANPNLTQNDGWRE